MGAKGVAPMKLSADMRLREGETWDALARRATRLGFGAIALPFGPQWSDADLLAIRQALDECRVQLVELACSCNFLTPSDDTARANLELLCRALAAGSLLNCDHVVTFAGSRDPDPARALAPHPDNWADATWDLLINRIWTVLDAAEDLGVRLCFEPHPSTTLNSLDSLAELMADAASVRVRVALDPAAVFTPAGAADTKRALAEIFATLADTIAVARATDVAVVQAGEAPRCEPAPVGQGILDYEIYLKLLNALELDTPLVVGHQPTDAALRAAHAHLAAAAKRAGIA